MGHTEQFKHLCQCILGIQIYETITWVLQFYLLKIACTDFIIIIFFNGESFELYVSFQFRLNRNNRKHSRIPWNLEFTYLLIRYLKLYFRDSKIYLKSCISEPEPVMRKKWSSAIRVTVSSAYTFPLGVSICEMFVFPI